MTIGTGRFQLASPGASSDPTIENRWLWTDGSTDTGYATPAISSGVISTGYATAEGDTATVQASLIYVAEDIEVSSLTVRITAIIASGVTALFGLYDVDGNLLVTFGSLPPGTEADLATMTFTPFLIKKGFYYFAQTAVQVTPFTSATVALQCFTENSSEPLVTTTWQDGNGSNQRCGQSTNLATSASLPSTLGTLSDIGSGFNLTAGLFQ